MKEQPSATRLPVALRLATGKSQNIRNKRWKTNGLGHPSKKLPKKNPSKRSSQKTAHKNHLKKLPIKTPLKNHQNKLSKKTPVFKNTFQRKLLSKIRS